MGLGGGGGGGEAMGAWEGGGGVWSGEIADGILAVGT